VSALHTQGTKVHPKLCAPSRSIQRGPGPLGRRIINLKAVLKPAYTSTNYHKPRKQQVLNKFHWIVHFLTSNSYACVAQVRLIENWALLKKHRNFKYFQRNQCLHSSQYKPNLLRISHHKTAGKYYWLNVFQIMGSECQLFISVVKMQSYLQHFLFYFRF
jgi:hypothetical protein